MKSLVFILLYSMFFCVKAQELFVFTEPASNMAKGNLGIRLMESTLKETIGDGFYTHVMPELMYGVSKNIMVHSTAFFSKKRSGFVAEGGSLYAKYKFLNIDDVKQHFRMSTFARYSFNNAKIHQEEINLIGYNTGYELGINATQLLHKFALSGGLSFIQALNNGKTYQLPKNQSANALYYTLSLGKLMLPKKYTDYKQTNVNLMCELLGQSLIPNGKYYLDIAPSIQFILMSKMRIDLAYRQQLYSSMNRTAPNGFFIRLEYNFYNVY